MDDRTPAVLDLLVEVFEDFRDNFVDRTVSGLGLMLASMVLIGVGLVLLYVPMGLGMFVGVVLDDELVAMLGSLVGVLVGVLAMLLVVTVPLMPLYASLGRAVLRNLDEGSDLGFSAPFETMTQDLGKVLGTSALVMLATFGGLMFCYLPGIIAGIVTGLAIPGVIVHRLGPVDAVKRSVDHAMENPVWHLGFYAVTMGITMVLTYVPVIGLALVYPFVLSFQIRAYVRIFGREP